MTRKDYQTVAKAISKVKPFDTSGVAIKNTIVNELSAAFESENPRFNAEKFEQVCHLG